MVADHERDYPSRWAAVVSIADKGVSVARCTIARPIREMGLAGVIRGETVRTTISDKAAPCPLDQVNRHLYAPAPNMLWVSNCNCVAFVIDTYARRIVAWRASRTADASFVLGALKQALHDRRPTHRAGLILHSDCGSQGGLHRVTSPLFFHPV